MSEVIPSQRDDAINLRLAESSDDDQRQNAGGNRHLQSSSMPRS